MWDWVPAFGNLLAFSWAGRKLERAGGSSGRPPGTGKSSSRLMSGMLVLPTVEAPILACGTCDGRRVDCRDDATDLVDP